jgi:hypothetical protein
MGNYIETVNEVTDYRDPCAGTAGPFNFNGLVRHYDLRQGPNVADIQVNLAAKGDRQQTEPSDCQESTGGAVKAIAEIAMAPGSRWSKCRRGRPVLSTLVAEVYGPDYKRQRELALEIRTDFHRDPGRGRRGLVHGRMTRCAIVLAAGPGKGRPERDYGSPKSTTGSGVRLSSGKPVGLLHHAGEKEEDVQIYFRSPPLADAGRRRAP